MISRLITKNCWFALLLWATTASYSMAETSANDWPMYNRTFDGQRFSPLAQINAANVGSIKEVCSVQLAKGGSFHTGPVVAGGLMYVTTAHDTFALDPKNCRPVWHHVYIPEQPEVWRTNRGVAYLGGKVFRGTGDGRLIAIDARTGKQIWKVAPASPQKGEFISSAPIASAGLVFIGTAGSDWGIRGRIMAFHADTGIEAWRFNTIPLAHEPGFDTWPSEAVAQVGGGGTWSSFTLDERNQEIFAPVGNPAPGFSPSYRPGANLYTDSVVVLNATTGQLKWWYQLTPHDGHDLDLAAAPVIYRNAHGKDIVALAGKDGFVHLVDRLTHRLLSKTAVTTVSKFKPVPTPEGVVLCPGAYGGVEWNGPTFDASRDALFVGAVDWCSIFKSGPVNHVAGEVFAGGSYQQVATQPTGWITSLNSTTGKVNWRYRSDAPVVAGVTATAGGIVFSGDLNGNFIVLESATGRVLKKKDTGGAIAGGVITYAVGGQQYIAITSGNVSRTTFGVLGVPSIIVMALAPNASAIAQRIDASKEEKSTLGYDGEYRVSWRDRFSEIRTKIKGWLNLSTPSPKPQVKSTQPSTATLRGRTLFSENCAGCHGTGLEGISGPALTGLGKRMSMNKIIHTIKHPVAPMPPLYPTLLSDKDVESIAFFLHSHEDRSSVDLYKKSGFKPLPVGLR